jgi:hypothetical protein
MDFQKKSRGNGTEREEINKRTMKNEETKLTGNGCMYCAVSLHEFISVKRGKKWRN